MDEFPQFLIAQRLQTSVCVSVFRWFSNEVQEKETPTMTTANERV
jgi:hypothetical protein